MVNCRGSFSLRRRECNECSVKKPGKEAVFLPGLGEAMDGLPIALAALGHRCMVVSPRALAGDRRRSKAQCGDVLGEGPCGDMQHRELLG